MYTPNHAMISLIPPHGTQIIGNVDGSYMFLFDRSLKGKVAQFLEELVEQVDAISMIVPAASSGTTPPAVKGTVLKGDVVFPMIPTSPPAKLDETVHVDAEVVEHMEAANKRGLHKDTEPAPPPEPSNVENVVPELMP